MTTLLRPFLLSSLALCFHANGQSIIAAGDGHSIAVCADHTVYVWGANGSGQLGLGTTAGVLQPTANPSLTDVKAVVAGVMHSVFLKNDGTVWGCGYNERGQLGNGTPMTPTAYSAVPVQPIGLPPITAIAAGGEHTVALASNGTVYTYGYNHVGQLGNGTTTNSNVPVAVSGLPTITAISTGEFHTLALDATGQLWIWGWNDGAHTLPMQVAGMNDVVAIDGGSNSSFVLRADSTLWAWGANDFGQLGNGTIGGSTTVPQQVIGLTDVVAFAVFYYHVAALRSDGTLWTWGWNSSGQLGNGTTVNNPVPAQVAGLTDVAHVAVSWRNSLALRTDGSLWAWGNNDAGQLGNGTTDPSTVPIQVQGLCALAMQVPAVDDASAGALFPNPGNGDFTIPVDPRSGTVQISVIDATGRTVFAQHHMANNGQVAVHAANALPPGLYTVRIAAGAVVKLQKLIVQHN